MSREILFRGKRTDNGEWVEGYLCECHHKDTGKYDYAIQEMFENGYIMHEVIPETVGQYTGLTDKNGKKIFEGDILESRASDNKEDWKRWIVTFHDGSFCFERDISRKRKHKHEQNLLCADEVKLYGLAVIGNIHDNPELMEADK